MSEHVRSRPCVWKTSTRVDSGLGLILSDGGVLIVDQICQCLLTLKVTFPRLLMTMMPIVVWINLLKPISLICHAKSLPWSRLERKPVFLPVSLPPSLVVMPSRPKKRENRQRYPGLSCLVRLLAPLLLANVRGTPRLLAPRSLHHQDFIIPPEHLLAL